MLLYCPELAGRSGSELVSCGLVEGACYRSVLAGIAGALYPAPLGVYHTQALYGGVKPADSRPAARIYELSVSVAEHFPLLLRP
jgi:hypothetical protein